MTPDKDRGGINVLYKTTDIYLLVKIRHDGFICSAVSKKYSIAETNCHGLLQPLMQELQKKNFVKSISEKITFLYHSHIVFIDKGSDRGGLTRMWENFFEQRSKITGINESNEMSQFIKRHDVE